MENIHATCVEIDNCGVLLIGASGSGKSDLALRLIENKSAILICDDRTNLSVRQKALLASCPQSIEGLIEVRGIGIVRKPFKKQTKIKLVVESSAKNNIERLPEEMFFDYNGILVPHILLNFFEASAPDKVVIKLNALLELKNKKNKLIHTVGKKR